MWMLSCCWKVRINYCSQENHGAVRSIDAAALGGKTLMDFPGYSLCNGLRSSKHSELWRFMEDFAADPGWVKQL